MYSSIEICNMALAHVGQEGIMSLDEDSKAARLCKQFYDYCRQSLLRLFPWSFALEYTELPREEKTGRYVVPVDCLYIAECNTKDFAVIQNTIKADVNPLFIWYVKDVTDLAQTDILFRELLALKIAKEICYNLTADMNLFQLLDNRYQQAEADARHRQSCEQRMQRVEEGNWLKVRG